MATGIKYIGKAEEHSDRIYGTGIHFERGRVYSIEDSVAAKMLLHTDTYAPGKIPPGTKMVRVVKEEIDHRRDQPPMFDFQRMEAKDLRNYAQLYFNEKLPSNALHQTLVDRLIAFSNRPT